MRVTRLSVPAFRNLRDVLIEPVESVNVICGENGQGKTNLLEALWLFTGARSFRGAKEAEMIPLGAEQAICELSFQAFGRAQEMRLGFGRKKAAYLNGVNCASPAGLSGSLCAAVFSPAHLSLVKGGPAERRRSLDLVIGQLKPRYQQVLTEYHRLLLQRNTLLKDISFSSQLLDTLDVWDVSVAKKGALITKTRMTYLERLAPLSREIYAGIAGGREELDLCYQATGAADGVVSEETMLTLLRRSRAEDLKTGSTSVGPHRDDFEISLSGLSARAYGSQGQQRSAVLALKLGECSLMERLTGEAPLVLLDDVMSELDERRRDYLLHHLENRQIFLTCCDPRQIEGASAVFEAKKGKIEPL